MSNKLGAIQFVEWSLFENVFTHDLRIQGKSISSDAWFWLETVKGIDSAITIQLTNQVLDEAFYAGLNRLLPEVGNPKLIRLEVIGLDICKLDINKSQTVNYLKKSATETLFEYSQKLREKQTDVRMLSILADKWARENRITYNSATCD